MDVEQKEVRVDVNRSVIQCTKPDYLVLLIPPSGLHLAGAFRFQCIFGRVTVAGFTQTGADFDDHRFVPFVVHNRAQVPLLFMPKQDEQIASNPELFHERLRFVLEYNAEDLEHALQFSAAILIDAGPKIAYQYLCQRFGNFTKPLDKFKTLHVSENCFIVKGIKMDSGFAPLPSYIHKDEIIHDAMDYACAHGNVLMVTGCKGAGKSTMNRYISNRYLSQGKSVHFLDTDVGQSEFTPPSCVSLVRVNEPILSLPFMHQRREFDHAICLNTISPGSQMGLYVTAVIQLYQKYAEICDENSVLVVNSHGWVEGLGLEIMGRLFEAIRPSTVINMKSYQINGFEISQLSSTQHYFDYPVLPRINEQTSREVAPRVLREYTICGYFANCLEDERFGQPSPERTLANLLAYQVAFDHVHLFFDRDRPPVKDNFIFSALNCAVVALCGFESEEQVANMKFRNMCNDSALPRILSCNDEQKAASFPCFGFGLIRAISPEKRLFYLITPMPTEMCSKTQLFVVPQGVCTPHFLFDRDDARSAPYIAQTRTPQEYDELVRDQNRVISALQTRLHSTTSFRAAQRVVGNNNQTKRVNQFAQRSEPPSKKPHGAVA